MIAAVIKFLASFWREVIIVSLVLVVIGYRESNQTLEKSLVAKDVKLQLQEKLSDSYITNIKELTTSIETLRKANENLDTAIKNSNLVIGKIGTNGSKIFAEIHKLTISDSCDEQINLLRDKAVERNK